MRRFSVVDIVNETEEGSNIREQMFADVVSSVQKLGLPEGFYHNLLHEDDWSFVIKLSALFEAAATHALTARLGYPKLLDSFSYLDHANTKYGKIKLLKELEVISPEQAKFLTKLAELRNAFAHNISNVSMTFDQYIHSMVDSKQREAFVTWAGHGIHQEHVSVEGNNIRKQDFVLDNAKLSIWGTAAEVLACIYVDADVSEHRNQLPLYQSLHNPVGQAALGTTK